MKRIKSCTFRLSIVFILWFIVTGQVVANRRRSRYSDHSAVWPIENSSHQSSKAKFYEEHFETTSRATARYGKRRPFLLRRRITTTTTTMIPPMEIVESKMTYERAADFYLASASHFDNGSKNVFLLPFSSLIGLLLYYRNVF